jgi:hypothetical protein
MIGALKRGDWQAIAKYDDIRPLQDHMLQAFSDAAARLTPTMRSPATPAAGGASDAGNGADPVLQALEGIGIAPDIAEVLLAEAKAVNPGLGPLDLVASIADKLRSRGPEAKSPKPRRAPKVKPAIEPGDLRAIVAAGQNAGLSGYEALLKGRIVKPPLPDLPCDGP